MTGVRLCFVGLMLMYGFPLMLEMHASLQGDLGVPIVGLQAVIQAWQVVVWWMGLCSFMLGIFCVCLDMIPGEIVADDLATMTVASLPPCDPILEAKIQESLQYDADLQQADRVIAMIDEVLHRPRSGPPVAQVQAQTLAQFDRVLHVDATEAHVAGELEWRDSSNTSVIDACMEKEPYAHGDD